MGAVKNLFVRIGCDASSAVKGFKDASAAGAGAEKSLKKSSKKTKQSMRDAFSSAVPSIKEYTAEIARTRTAHQTAKQNITRLQNEISKMTGVYDMVKNATSGLDLTKPLSELMVDAEKSLTAIESKRRKVEAELRGMIDDPKTAKSKRTAALQAELKQLAEKSRFAQARMADLDRIADAVGSSNIGYASAQGLEQLQGEIQSAQNKLRTTKMVAEETGQKLKSMGVGPYIGQALKGIGKAAGQAAGTGVKKLWNGLKGLGGSAVRGIASLPAKLRNIGKSAASSNGGLGKMVRSIRNIGIASLGMKVATGLFGKMRSVISSYISQNEELNASVTSIKNQMGEALLPAINVVIAAMQRLMPVVTKVSSAINSVFKSLFGDIAITSKKVESASEELNTYGFDQITKESDGAASSSSTSAQAAEQSAMVTRLTEWLQKLKAAFMAGDWKTLGGTIADGINSVFDAVRNVDVGGIFGNFINAIMTTAHSLFTRVDFRGIGSLVGQKMTDAFKTINWKTVGEVIGLVLLALPSMLVGWVLGTDWLVVGQSISEMLSSAFQTGTAWIASVDWLALGDALEDLIKGVNWGGLANDLRYCLGAAIGACVGMLWGLLDDVAKDIMNYFADAIDAAGGNVAKGIWNAFIGILEGLANSLVSALNALIKGFNKIVGIGGTLGLKLEIPTIPDVKLPRAARGTIVSSATDLTVGEDGTEAVMPLERHTEWLDVLAAKLSDKMPNGGTGSGTSLTLPIYLGGRKVTEYFIKDINQITRENGVCPINA